MNYYIESKFVSIDESNFNQFPQIPAGEYTCIFLSLVEKKQDNTKEDYGYSEPKLSSSNKIVGAGLGIAIVRNIVKDFNGFFTETTGDNIPRYSVYFPIAESMNKEFTSVLHDPKTSSGLTNIKTGLILVIDDEPIILQMIRDSLELLGYNSVLASSGEEGIQKFKQNIKEIDLLILDLYIPDKDGEQILKELRQLKPGLKVLIASGYEYKRKAAAMEALNVNGYLPKPFKINELEDKLNRIIENREIIALIFNFGKVILRNH